LHWPFHADGAITRARVFLAHWASEQRIAAGGTAPLLAILINFSLFFFNLLPIPPLDGSRVVRNMLPYNAVQQYDRIGGWISYLMIFVGSFILSAWCSLDWFGFLDADGHLGSARSRASPATILNLSRYNGMRFFDGFFFMKAAGFSLAAAPTPPKAPQGIHSPHARSRHSVVPPARPQRHAPHGKAALGNYMGALANWVKLQDGYDCYFFIADWHALTTDYADTSQIVPNTIEVMLDYLAAGLDPERSVLFLQSRVKQHAELFLDLAMISPLGWLERVPSYKEMQENLAHKDLTTYGFLGYPVLMAADILLYQPNFVPVGQDQQAHVELTREIARRFNQFYKLPAAANHVDRDVFPNPRSCSRPRPSSPAPTAAKCRRATATRSS
jgi:hypothetical protein